MQRIAVFVTLTGSAVLPAVSIIGQNLNVFHIVVWHWGVGLIGTAAGALREQSPNVQRQRNPKTY